MDHSEITPTLLNAILTNQHALVDAISELVDWAEAEGSTSVVGAVRNHLDRVKSNQNIIGSCIGALMQPK